MEMYIKKMIGKTAYTFVASGENLYEMVTESQKLSFPDIPICGICGKNNLSLSSHLAQNQYKYTTVRCADCRASVTFGQKKEDPDTFFLRRNDDKSLKWEKQPEMNDNGTSLWKRSPVESAKTSKTTEPKGVISADQRKRLMAIAFQNGWITEKNGETDYTALNGLIKDCGFQRLDDVLVDAYDDICNTMESNKGRDDAF